MARVSTSPEFSDWHPRPPQRLAEKPPGGNGQRGKRNDKRLLFDMPAARRAAQRKKR